MNRPDTASTIKVFTKAEKKAKIETDLKESIKQIKRMRNLIRVFNYLGKTKRLVAKNYGKIAFTITVLIWVSIITIALFT